MKGLQMEEYYKIMSDILDIEYKMKAIIYVLDELENCYSEEDDFKEKYLLSVMRGSFGSVQNDVKGIIVYIDQLTTEGKRKNQI